MMTTNAVLHKFTIDRNTNNQTVHLPSAWRYRTNHNHNIEMSPTPRLTDWEKGQIEVFGDRNLWFSEIAEKLGRHRTTISFYTCQKFSRKTPRKIDRPPELSQRTIRNIIRHVVSLKLSPKTFKRVLNLSISVRTIQRLLQESSTLMCMKRIPITGLTSKQ